MIMGFKMMTISILGELFFSLWQMWRVTSWYPIMHNSPGSPMSWGTTPRVLTGEYRPFIRFNLSVGSCWTTLPAEYERERKKVQLNKERMQNSMRKYL